MLLWYISFPRNDERQTIYDIRERERINRNMRRYAMKFNHENLDVYRVALEFLAFTYEILQNIPSGYSFLSDQFKRASLSIVLNIAEGSGKVDRKEQTRFYKISRGSANESTAILDALQIFQLISKDEQEKGRSLLFRIICMLSKMTL